MRVEDLGRFADPGAGSLSSMKLLFAPVGIGTGIVAGLVARKTFERVWAAIDEEDPPQPDQAEVPLAKLVAALALEGAIFRLAKGAADHGARAGVARLTGRWPG
jgi:hypothetical protein